MKALTEINLNEAFGFATIIAAINGAKDVFSVNIVDVPIVPALFFVYFFIFRTKMYLDDKDHDFADGGALDISIAIISWILFLISAASIDNGINTDSTGDGINIAVQWFIAAMLVSSIWVVYSLIRNFSQEDARRRYLFFLSINLVHIVLLYSISRDFLPDLPYLKIENHGLVLVLLSALAAWDWHLTARDQPASRSRRR